MPMLEPAETVAILQKQPDAQTVSAGEIIFTAGEEGKVMYGILAGEIEMLVNGEVVETLKASDVFGEGALVQPDHRRASTARAKTDCKLAFIDQHHFLFAIQNSPMFAVEVMRSYSDRLRRLKHKL